MRQTVAIRLARSVGFPSRHSAGHPARHLSSYGRAGGEFQNHQQSGTEPPQRTHAQSAEGSRQPGQQQRGFTSINNRTPYNLCFLRHGQSTWNRDNRFIGWTDTPLTDDGVLEARVAGKMLKNSGILFDEVHTSLLRRCIRTTNLVLMEMEQEYIPVHKVSLLHIHMILSCAFVLSNIFVF